MRQIRNDIEGPGVSRAIDEAIKANKQLVFAYDHDKSGNILRIGYYLEGDDLGGEAQNKIIWFKEGEVRLRPTLERNLHSIVKGRLEVSFKHTKANERHILIELPTYEGNQITLRNLFRITNNEIMSFVIQVEIKGIIKGKNIRKPIIRYDCAHGFIHRDLIARNGKKTKETLKSQEIRNSIISAIDEIPPMLQIWLNQLGFSEVAPAYLNQPRVTEDLEKAKLTLLDLVDNPKKMDTTESKLIQFR